MINAFILFTFSPTLNCVSLPQPTTKMVKLHICLIRDQTFV